MRRGQWWARFALPTLRAKLKNPRSHSRCSDFVAAISARARRIRHLIEFRDGVDLATFLTDCSKRPIAAATRIPARPVQHNVFYGIGHGARNTYLSHGDSPVRFGINRAGQSGACEGRFADFNYSPAE
jgi:hypothetical protein